MWVWVQKTWCYPITSNHYGAFIFVVLVNYGFFYPLSIQYPLTVMVAWGLVLSLATLMGLRLLLTQVIAAEHEATLWNSAVCLSFILVPLALFGLSGFRLYMVPPLMLGFYFASRSLYWPISLILVGIGSLFSLIIGLIQGPLNPSWEGLWSVVNLASVCVGLAIIVVSAYERQKDLGTSVAETIKRLEAQVQACAKQLLAWDKENEKSRRRRRRWKHGVISPRRPHPSQWLLEKATSLLPEEHALVMQHIQFNSGKFSLVIENALELSTRQPLMLTPLKELSLGNVVKKTLAKLQTNYPQHPAQLMIHQPVRIKGYPILLERLINHLWTNSILYGASTLTRIDIFRSPSYAYLSLSDNGLPLSETEEAFLRGETALPEENVSVSLKTLTHHRSVGLAMAQKLVVALGGKFSLSCREGRTSFICQFPRLESKNKASMEPPVVTFSTRLSDWDLSGQGEKPAKDIPDESSDLVHDGSQEDVRDDTQTPEQTR